MITKLTKICIVFSLLMCGKEICIAQCENQIEISACKVTVADTDMIALLDTMYFIVDKCGIDKSSLYFYICESDFDGGSRFFGKALPYEASSYQEMWHNKDLNKTDDLFWKAYYFYHKEVLCVCNADHEFLFKDISLSLDTLLLPLNMPQKKLFYLLVVPQTSSNCAKYCIYTSCD